MNATAAEVSRSLSLLDNAVAFATRRNDDASTHAKRRRLEANLLETRSLGALAEVTAFARELYAHG